MWKVCGRFALTALVCASSVSASAFLLGGYAQAPGAKPKTVLELFTSQGCSACPPADELLGKFADRDDVVALTLPVDYWDYLGWKDTLASPEHTARQRAYAKARGDNQVYTPQVVVNGLTHVVGNKESKIDQAIAMTSSQIEGRRVSLELSSRDDTLIIDVGEAAEGSGDSGVVWLMRVKKSVTVEVQRGENRGKTITYHNVVRRMMPVGKWSGEATTLKLPLRELLRTGAEACAVLVQQGSMGPILAAATFP